MSARRPLVEPTWTRVEPGLYTWADYSILREATTHGMRRASNPQWSVYVDGTERRVARRATLAEAKAYVRSHSTRRQR